MIIDKDLIELLKSGAKKMHKHKKRMFQAEVANKYFGGSVKVTEKTMGWGRESIALGLHELEIGIYSVCNYSNCGRKRLEEIFEHLTDDIATLVGNDVQADAKLRTTFQYCRLTAPEICKRLKQEMWTNGGRGYEEDDFTVRGIEKVLNRLGYRLKKT